MAAMEKALQNSQGTWWIEEGLGPASTLMADTSMVGTIWRVLMNTQVALNPTPGSTLADVRMVGTIWRFEIYT